MLAAGLTKSAVERCRKNVESSEEAKRFLEQLRSGEAKVYFRSDASQSGIDYEAFNDDFTVYHSLALDLTREPRTMYRGEKTEFACALLLYLYETERGLNDEDLHRIYEDLYTKFRVVASLSPEKARYREEHRREFEYLADLVASAVSNEKDNKAESVCVQFSFDRSYIGKVYEVSASLTGGKAQRVKDLRTLFSAAIQRTRVSLYGGKTIVLDSSSFSESQRLAIQFISARSNFSKWSSTTSKVELADSDLPALFDLLRGDTIALEGVKRVIGTNPVTPTLKVNDEGNLSFDVSFDDGFLFLSGLSGYFVSNSHEITPIQFDSEAKLKIYKFTSDHPHFQFDAFQPEVDEVILPALSGAVEVSDKYREKHPSRRREIVYQVTYGEEDELRFSTEFHVGDDIVNREEYLSNRVAETQVFRFEEELNKLHLPLDGATRDQTEILAFLKADLSELSNCCKLLLSDNITKRVVSKVGKFNIVTKSGIDWMDVTLSSKEYSQDEFMAILAGYKRKKKYVRIRGQFISLSEEDDEYGLKKVIDDFNIDDGLESPKLPIYQAFKLPGYESGFKIEYNQEIKNLIGDIKDYKDCEVPLEKSIASKLRPYQLDGVKWLYAHARRKLPGILADEMGLGKTLQSIALLSTMEENAPFLIVCPKSLIYNWQNEFKLWYPSLEAYVVSGAKQARTELVKAYSRKRCALIVSYDSLRNDLETFSDVHFACIVLDEGQNIANVYAKKTKAVKSLESTQHFVLTGTPIQNSLSDLWSIFDFMMPGFFEPFKQFNYVYGNLGEGMEETKRLLMDKIAPFIMKRTKKDVLKDLPPKEEQVITIAMNEEQRRVYDAYFQKQNFDRTNRDNAQKFQILAALTRLREICVDPSMFLEGMETVPAKFEVAIGMIKQAIAEGHKVLLFSTFAQSLFHLKNYLDFDGISSAIIYGDTPALERVRMAEDFNRSPEVKVMLVSLKAGGTGLNLVGADIVIHLDPWWNIAAENQASDRAHRIGQKRKVTILKLVCKDTIEEKVIELQQMKKELASVVSEGDEGLSRISLDDLWFLVS